MTEVTISRRGEIELPQDMLDHLGVRPGERISIAKLPKGVVSLRAAPTGDISAFFGVLAREGQRPLTLDEMNDARPPDWDDGK
jgi:antitoxin PrlF